ncbi:MAG: nucleotide exchange factor GrpE [Verrucomicrobiota bacterium]
MKHDTGKQINSDLAENTPAPSNVANGPDDAELSPEDIASLKERAAKADDHWDRLLRQTADYDNYKKRAAREKQDATKYANESLLQKLIPVVDNFEAALAASNTASASAESLQTGVNMIYTQLKSALADSGLEEIDASNQPFDPNFHEAVSQKETTDVPEGQVVQQLRKGYKLRDRLIRPATVIVAKKPAKN